RLAGPLSRSIGVNTWVWASPLDDEALARLAPRIREWGFDTIELPVEDLGDWDPGRAADLLGALGLDATVVLVMGPGRELVAADGRTVAATREYLRGVVDAAPALPAAEIPGPAGTGRRPGTPGHHPRARRPRPKRRRRR